MSLPLPLTDRVSHSPEKAGALPEVGGGEGGEALSASEAEGREGCVLCGRAVIRKTRWGVTAADLPKRSRAPSPHRNRSPRHIPSTHNLGTSELSGQIC